ncbi:MAG: hypothetical protein ABFC56_09520 [Clostridiaceae bacterium]
MAKATLKRKGTSAGKSKGGSRSTAKKATRKGGRSKKGSGTSGG